MQESGFSREVCKKLKFPNFIKQSPEKVKTYEIFILTVLNNKIYFTCLQYQKRIGGVHGSSLSLSSPSKQQIFLFLPCLPCALQENLQLTRQRSNCDYDL
jgi:hypothetical protein